MFLVSRSVLRATVVLALGLVPAAGVAAATPVETGCPASAALTSVASFDANVYRLPARLDDAANGGNGDGWVCTFPLPEAVATAAGTEHTIYQFFENTLPAKDRP